MNTIIQTKLDTATLLLRKICLYPIIIRKYTALLIITSVILSGCGGGTSYSSTCSDARKSAVLYKTIEFIDVAESSCPHLRWLGNLESIYHSWNGRSYHVAVPYPDHSLDNDGFLNTSDISNLLNKKTNKDIYDIYIDLFGAASLPAELPTLILSNENIPDNHSFKLTLTESLRANVEVSFYENTLSYLGGALTYKAGYVLYKPSINPLGVVILFQGHDNEYLNTEALYFLEKGFAVILRGMPGFLDDHAIFYNGEKFLGGHDGFYDLESDDFNPFALFIEPNIVAINLAHAVYPLTKIYVGGLSGGGLISLLIHAFDPRVSASFSVSGYKPFFLRYRSGIKDFQGDYEQNTKRFYYRHRINFLDLVVLASQNGMHYQVWVEGDTSAFGGSGYKHYAEQMRRYTQGRFQLILDSVSVSHKIELKHLDAFLNRINH